MKSAFFEKIAPRVKAIGADLAPDGAAVAAERLGDLGPRAPGLPEVAESHLSCTVIRRYMGASILLEEN